MKSLNTRSTAVESSTRSVAISCGVEGTETPCWYEYGGVIILNKLYVILNKLYGKILNKLYVLLNKLYVPLNKLFNIK